MSLSKYWQFVDHDPDKGVVSIETIERGRDVPSKGYPVAIVYTGVDPEQDRGVRLLLLAPDMYYSLLEVCNTIGPLVESMDPHGEEVIVMRRVNELIAMLVATRVIEHKSDRMWRQE